MINILIIDDEQRIRNSFQQVFAAAGRNVFQVLTAGHAEEATEILLREDIDLVLLDIRMPRINGRVMYDVIKDFGRNVKVIVTSVYPIEEQKKMIPYATDYYDKSHGPIKLLEKATGVFVHN